ncbi:hypothetical protein LAZ67_4001565 [Cordylochernes scorpioides]|uniref:Transposase n=1 Tax=Cordylochernes scorpioides TaxID=51811 RepID=A0ABY6KDX1_9ARAC|nr:hypothetical protein LAZ67_4001565 [Cordylochernes scorpioides]
MEILYSRQRSTQQQPPGPTHVQWPHVPSYIGQELAKYPFLINQEKLTTDAFRAVGPHQRGASCTSTTRFMIFQDALMTNFLVVEGLVHYEFVPECQTINQHYYLDVLRRLREPVRQKRPGKWHQKNWLLHHDNARPHTAVTVPLYLAKHGISLLPQLPYSPDLLTTTFSFTLKLKES